MIIAILGFGKEGRAALKYWSKQDPSNQITICDVNPEVKVPDGVESRLGEDYLNDLDQFDLIVRSPFTHPRHIVKANGEAILEKVTTGTNEFIAKCPAPIIGVTGTKGKGTTSSLIAKIIEATNQKVHLGGNIGVPPVEMLSWDIKPEDWVVLELSSFQLIDLKKSPKVAVGLMVVPEHLDWHQDLPEYVHSKQNLFRHQTEDDFAVYNRLSDYSREIGFVSKGFQLTYEVPPVGQQPSLREGAYVLDDQIYMDEQVVCSVSDVSLLGRHNLENVCAAITATWDLIGHNTAAIIQAISSFKGLPHRLELVANINDVSYYDDSFGTTPETAMVALESIKQAKVLILGGSDKGARYDQLARTVLNSNVRAVICIGKTGATIARELYAVGFSNIIQGGDNMRSIVESAKQLAHPGDAVLLSTGCASFGMFKDYTDRGEQFQEEVRALQQNSSHNSSWY